MMVEGTVNGQKITEGHWYKKNGSKRTLNLKLDFEPKNLPKTFDVTIRYGKLKYSMTVNALSWNDRYSYLHVVEV